MSEIYQGHGDHWESIYADKKEIVSLLPEALQNSHLIGMAQDVEYYDEENGVGKFDFACLDFPLNSQLSCCLLIKLDRANQQNEVESFYPFVKNGVEKHLKLTKIQEWDNRVEAILTAEDNMGKEYRFFDTLYALNKNQYEIGKYYSFALSGLIDNAEILEGDKASFTFEGQQAVDFLLKLGENVEDAETVEPIKFDLSNLVAFLQTHERAPHIAEFQSPIIEVRKDAVQENKLYSFDIYSYKDEEDNASILPVWIKQKGLNVQPKINMPLRGMLYLFGQMVNHAEVLH